MALECQFSKFETYCNHLPQGWLRRQIWHGAFIYFQLLLAFAFLELFVFENAIADHARWLKLAVEEFAGALTQIEPDLILIIIGIFLFDLPGRHSILISLECRFKLPISLGFVVLHAQPLLIGATCS